MYHEAFERLCADSDEVNPDHRHRLVRSAQWRSNRGEAVATLGRLSGGGIRLRDHYFLHLRDGTPQGNTDWGAVSRTEPSGARSRLGTGRGRGKVEHTGKLREWFAVKR